MPSKKNTPKNLIVGTVIIITIALSLNYFREDKSGGETDAPISMAVEVAPKLTTPIDEEPSEVLIEEVPLEPEATFDARTYVRDLLPMDVEDIDFDAINDFLGTLSAEQLTEVFGQLSQYFVELPEHERILVGYLDRTTIEEFTRMVTLQWAKHEPSNATVALIDSKIPGQYQEVLYETVPLWAAQDPHGSLEYVRHSPNINEAIRYHLMGSTVRYALQEDATKWINEHVKLGPDQPKVRPLLDALAYNVPEEKLEEVSVWMTDYSEYPEVQKQFPAFITTYGAHDPDLAFSWGEGIKDPEIRFEAMKNLFAMMSYDMPDSFARMIQDPETVEKLEQLQDEVDPNEPYSFTDIAVARYVRASIREDLDAAKASVGAIQDEALRKGVLTEIDHYEQELKEERQN